jgi:hypothetical protein
MVTPLKPVAPLKPSKLAPRAHPYHKHDSFNPNCWCKPKLKADGVLLVHNDVPYPYH